MNKTQIVSIILTGLIVFVFTFLNTETKAVDPVVIIRPESKSIKIKPKKKKDCGCPKKRDYIPEVK